MPYKSGNKFSSYGDTESNTESKQNTLPSIDSIFSSMPDAGTVKKQEYIPEESGGVLSKTFGTPEQWVEDYANRGRQIAKSANLASAGFMDRLDKMASKVSELTGLEKGGLFANARDAYLSNAEKWDNRISKTGLTDEIIGEVIGGAIPGVFEFSMGAVYSGLVGYAEGGAKEGLKQAAERALMGRILHGINTLKVIPRTVLSGALGASEAAVAGGDARDVAKSAATLGIFGATATGGKKVGLREALGREKPLLLDSETKVKVKRVEKPKSKPVDTKPTPKPVEETTPPSIDEVINNLEKDLEPNQVSLESPVYDKDLVKDAEPVKINIDKENVPENNWDEFVKGNIDPNILAKIVADEHLKGVDKIKVQPKDLQQPAILLADGVIIKGPSIDKWTISEPGTAHKDIPAAWSAARETARRGGFNPEEATNGFIAKGKFINNDQAIEKLKLHEKVETVKSQLDTAIKHFEDNPGKTVEEASKDLGAKGFKTEKGSMYIINKDNTTTRNKAARSEHPGEKGIQPKSTKTWYVSKEDAIKLSEVQAEGGPKTTVSELPDGRIGVKYLEGKDKGKFEKRTVVTPKKDPDVGLLPVEYWDDNHTIHFGNKIIEVQDKVPRNVVRQAKSMYEDLRTMTGELDIESAKKDLEKLQKLRKATQSDRLAMTIAKKAKKNPETNKYQASVVKRVVNKFRNTSLGKRFEPEEINSIANKAMWEFIRRQDPETIQNYIDRKDVNTFEGPAYKAMEWAILNSMKESLGSGIGMSRGQVAKALEEGKLFTPLSLEEGLVTGTESKIVEGEEVGKKSTSIIDKQIKEDTVTEEDRKPGEVKKISIEEYKKQKELENQQTQTSKQRLENLAKKKSLSQTTKEDRQIQQDVRDLQQRERELKVELKDRREKVSAPGVTGEKTRRSVQSQQDRQELNQSTGRRITDQVNQTNKQIELELDAKTTKFLNSKLKQEKGSSPELRTAVNISNKLFTGILNKINAAKEKTFKTFDIEWQWKKIGAHKTGLALKNVFSRQDAEERLALRKLDSFYREIQKGFGKTKLNKIDLFNIVSATEFPKKLKDFDIEYQQKILPSVKWLSNYFKESQQLLKDRGIDVDYKARALSEIDEAIKNNEIKDYYKYLKALQDRVKLMDMQFVHIPLKMWFDTQVKTAMKKLKVKDIGGYQKAMANLKLVTTIKRRPGSFINDMVDKGLIKAEDVNPIDIILNYSRRFGHDMAIADIRDAALKEGLIKINKSKPTKGYWEKIPKRLAALQVGTPADKTAYIDSKVMSYIDEQLGSKFSQNSWSKAMSIVKMSQFYNPLILPMYDMIQSSMAVGMYPTKWPKAAITTIKDVTKKTDNYYDLLKNGLASKPFAMPFNEWVRISDIRTEQALGNNFIKSWSKAYIKEFKKTPIKTLLKTPYIASWQTAWTLDEYVRMFTANVLKDTGLSTQEAAQTAALFHGDYAGVPAKTRKVLNNAFFTPTFKIAMTKLYGTMIESALTEPFKLNNNSMTGSVFAKGLLAAMAVNIAFDTLLTKQMGFKDDQYFRRYVKDIETDEGPKQLVITLSNPANLPFKMYNQVAKPFVDWAIKENKPLMGTAVMNGLFYELHPTYRIAQQFYSNERLDGRKIVSEFDDRKTQAVKYAQFFAEELYPVLKGAKSVIAGPEVDSKTQRMAKEALQRDYDKLTQTFVNWLAFSYIRNSDELNTSYKIKALKRSFSKQMKDYVREHDDTNIDWVQRMEKMIGEMQDDLEKK